MTDTATTLCYIGIGSNLENPLQQVNKAISSLTHAAGIQLKRRSPWYGSKAVGPGKQDDYINGVIELETKLDAAKVLQLLQAIETAQGRVRGEKWGARTLDLDILLFGDQTCNSELLSIPHPHMTARPFVMGPLADLCPQRVLPLKHGKSATIADLWNQLPKTDLWPLENENKPVAL